MYKEFFQISKIAFFSFFVTIALSETSYAFFHDEDEEVCPRSKAASSTPLEYNNPLRDFFSGLTFGLITDSNHQNVTYNGQKMPRYLAKVKWDIEKSWDQYEREKKSIVYDPNVYVEPRYNWKTLEELRESGGIRYLHYRTVQDLEAAQETYRQQMTSIYGEEEIRKQDAKKEAILQRNRRIEENKKKKEEEERQREKDRREAQQIIGQWEIKKDDPPHVFTVKERYQGDVAIARKTLEKLGK